MVWWRPQQTSPGQIRRAAARDLHRQSAFGTDLKSSPGRWQLRRNFGSYFTCPETCLVISNMVTCFLPPKTALRASSALISVFFFAS